LALFFTIIPFISCPNSDGDTVVTELYFKDFYLLTCDTVSLGVVTGFLKEGVAIILKVSRCEIFSKRR